MQPQSPEVAVAGKGVEVDAAGCTPTRVEGVDEGLLAAAVVERVRPPAARAERTRERIPAHLVALLMRIDDGRGEQLVLPQVVSADEVASRILRRDVLDQVKQVALRGDRVEAEVAPEAENRFHPQLPRVENRQGRPGAREPSAGLDQD